MLESLFAAFDPILVLDTETTGIRCRSDEIIELGFVRLSREGERREEDYLLRLSPGRRLPPEIERLTGISEKDLRERGVEKTVGAEALCAALEGEAPLLAAYNAQFDLCFLYYFLHRLGRAEVLRKCRFLDVMAVYKDRRDYPHRLDNAVEEYAVEGVNSHRASDDAAAALAVLCAMERERDDIAAYVNLFGYNPKYGPPQPAIASIRYEPQPYDRRKLLYESHNMDFG